MAQGSVKLANQRGRRTLVALSNHRGPLLDHPEVARRVLVCLEPRPRRTEDGIDVLPAEDFAAQLWRGGLGFG